jgi:hypothetical protein
MRTAAAASRSARDWRKQSHADGRRCHAKHDAQSFGDHCHPPCEYFRAQLFSRGHQKNHKLGEYFG